MNTTGTYNLPTEKAFLEEKSSFLQLLDGIDIANEKVNDSLWLKQLKAWFPNYAFLQTILPNQNIALSVFDIFEDTDLECINSKRVEFEQKRKFYPHEHNTGAFYDVDAFMWHRVVNYFAQGQIIKPFDTQQETSLIVDLKQVFTKKDVQKNLAAILQDYGIKFVVLDKQFQKKSLSLPIKGMVFWQGNNPVVGLVNLNNIDSVIFTIFHELGHIFKHSREFIYADSGIYNDSAQIEKEANEYANSKLMDTDIWLEFLQKSAFSDKEIRKIANKMNLPASLVKKRLFHEKYIS